MQRDVWLVTGTDTGVGKTVLTALLARRLAGQGVSVAALKPLCSGGREDVRQLHAALQGSLTPDQINPWHFRAPLAPPVAAQREGRKIRRAEVLSYIRDYRRRFDVTLVEGAGGLLSPMGDDFTARDLLVTLDAVPVVVAPNRLGAVNQVLLVLEALPPAQRRRAQVVLMEPARSTLASRTNHALLDQWMNPRQRHSLPWLRKTKDYADALRFPAVRRPVDEIVKALRTG